MKRERPGMMHLKKVTNTVDYDSYGLPGAARPRPQLAVPGRRRPGRSPSRRPPTGVCGAPAPAPGRESHNAQLGLGRPCEGEAGGAAGRGRSPGAGGEQPRALGRSRWTPRGLGSGSPTPRAPAEPPRPRAGCWRRDDGEAGRRRPSPARQGPPRARSPRGGAAAPPGGRSGVARGGHVPGKAPAERCPGRRAGGGPPSALGGRHGPAPAPRRPAGFSGPRPRHPGRRDLESSRKADLQGWQRASPPGRPPTSRPAVAGSKAALNRARGTLSPAATHTDTHTKTSAGFLLTLPQRESSGSSELNPVVLTPN